VLVKLTECFILDVAFSSKAIETRDVVGANFKYTKILTLPFFGGGAVDIPSGGFKRPKNTRKMHMLFFVFCGKVQVTVASETFTISKGGVWQVPQGMFNWR
jgi:centromere protein C